MYVFFFYNPTAKTIITLYYKTRASKRDNILYNLFLNNNKKKNKDK